MTNWVCNQDGTVFPVGLPRCPSRECGARDAHELGGYADVNVYGAVELTGIEDPGAAWSAVSEALAVAKHEHRMAADLPAAEAEVAERLGLVPGDPGASDPSTDPEPVELTAEGDGTGRALPDAVEGDNTERVDDRYGDTAGTEVFEEAGDSAGSAPASKQKT